MIRAAKDVKRAEVRAYVLSIAADILDHDSDCWWPEFEAVEEKEADKLHRVVIEERNRLVAKLKMDAARLRGKQK